MSGTFYRLKPGHTITATKVNNDGFITQVQDESVRGAVTSSLSFGPYLLERDFIVQGDVSVVIAEADIAANIPSTDQAAMLDAIPAADAGDSVTVWNDAGVLKVSGAGA